MSISPRYSLKCSCRKTGLTIYVQDDPELMRSQQTRFIVALKVTTTKFPPPHNGLRVIKIPSMSAQTTDDNKAFGPDTHNGVRTECFVINYIILLLYCQLVLDTFIITTHDIDRQIRCGIDMN